MGKQFVEAFDCGIEDCGMWTEKHLRSILQSAIRIPHSAIESLSPCFSSALAYNYGLAHL
jgi:hypothetical protein